MASVQYLYLLASNFQEEIEKKQFCLTELRKYTSACATIIQTEWRRYIQVRKYKKLKSSALVVQRYARGWFTRKHIDDYKLAKLKFAMHAKLVRSAIKIQAFWRGYYERKLLSHRGLNYLKRKEERSALFDVNDRVRSIFKELFKDNRDCSQEIAHEQCKQDVLFILFKCHHLLRTKQIRGVYSYANSDELTFIEQLMKEIPLIDYMKELRAKYYREIVKIKPAQYIFKKKRLRKLEDLMRLQDRSMEGKGRQLQHTTEGKAFLLSTKVTQEKYTRAITAVGKYDDKQKFPRDYSTPRRNDFRLGGPLDLKDKFPPYYIDFLTDKLCDEHYCKFYH